MKRTFLFIGILVVALQLRANENTLSITVCQPSYSHIPEEARSMMENKLDQILVANDVQSGMSDRFVISAKVAILKKDIMPTTPVKVSMKMDVTVMIGDVIDNKVFGKSTITIAGIGETESQAFIQSFQRISSNNAQLQALITSAKTQIITYYSTNCDDIIAKAERLYMMGQEKEAMQMLLAVPTTCEDCYQKAYNHSISIYKNIVNDKADLLLQQARKEWAIGHNYAQAQKALDYLAQVDSKSDKVAARDALFKEIEQTLKKTEAAREKHQQELEQREWDLKIQQYNDNVALRKQRMDMFQAIGVAIGQGLPQTVTKVVKTW